MRSDAPSKRPFFLLALLAAVLIAGCSEPVAPPQEAAPRPAKLHRVQMASLSREVTFPAVVRAAQATELTFQLSGEVVELNALEGQEVEQGFVLARLDQRDARNALAQSQAEFANARSEYERAQRLIADEAISRSVLDSRETQLAVARAALDVAQKALDDTTLRAPYDGSISSVFIEQFQNVQSKEAILQLQSRTIEVVIDAPGSIIARSPTLEPVGTRVELDVAPGVEIPATFREASGVADQATQTYQLSFTFEPPPGLLILPGMTALLKSTFLFSDSESLVAAGVNVPLSAILSEGDTRYVWQVDPDSQRVSKQAVTVGVYSGSGVVITRGLQAGDTVVAAGVSFLHEGIQVQPWTPDP